MHTKGPWWTRKGTYPNGPIIEVISADGKLIALIAKKEKDETEDNARLLSAAPELLEELEHLIYLINKLSEWEDHTQKARIVVSKAKGLST